MIEFPTTAVTPRSAATVMLARPAQNTIGAEEYEIFMLRRSARSAFVPDMYVFPGGGLDAADGGAEAQSVAAGLTVAQAVASFRDSDADANVRRDPAPPAPLDPTQSWGLYFACARELFEEACVLLTAPSTPPPDPVWLAERRAALNRRETTFVALLRDAGLRLDMRRLIYFSRWITPPIEKRRYDTRFFFAALSEGEGEQAAADEKETTAGIWIAPSIALQRHAAGDFGIIYPTIEHLKRLAAHPTLADATTFARTKPVIAVTPDSWRGGEDESGRHYEFKLQPEVDGRW